MYEALNLPLNAQTITSIDKLDVRHILSLLTNPKLWKEVFQASSHLEPFHRNLAYELRQVIQMITVK